MDDEINMCEIRNTNLKSTQLNCNNNNTKQQKNMMNVFAKKQAVDITFDDISFSYSTWKITKLKKGKNFIYVLIFFLIGGRILYVP